MKNRILSFIKTEKLTPARFADIIGVQPSAISHIISERNKPSLEVVQKMLTSFPKLNPEWLVMGNGTMYKETDMQNMFEKTVSVDNQGIIPIAFEKQDDTENTVNDILNAENSPQNAILEQNNKQIKSNTKEVERIIICYSDKTFEFYLPR